MPRLSYVGFKVLPFMAIKAKYAKRKVRMRAAHTANTARGTENKPRFPFCCGFRKWAPISRDNERATMKHIPTTATTVRKIQEAAKVIKKAAKISYMNALHQATQEAGYENWHHVLKCQAEPAPTKALPYERTQVDSLQEGKDYMAFLAKRGRATLKHNEPAGAFFHDVEIEGLRFKAGINENGPFIVCQFRQSPQHQRWHEQGGGMFGPDFMAYGPAHNSRNGKQWTVYRYGFHDACFSLGELSTEGRYALAHEFGIPVIEDAENENWQLIRAAGWPPPRALLFRLCPAWQSLCQWATRHPRIIRRSTPSILGLGNWRGDALDGKPPA